MDPLARITVSLSVVAPREVNLKQLTMLTGIEPTRVWRQQNATTAANHPQLDYQEWTVELPRYPADTFDSAINAVLDLVWDVREPLLRFCVANRAHVTIHLSPLASADVIVFAIGDPRTIERVASLHGRIHFHF
jgi:hypothetical protein